MVYAWRRHLASAITRMLADAGIAWGLTRVEDAGFNTDIEWASIDSAQMETDTAAYRSDRVRHEEWTRHAGCGARCVQI